MRPADISDRPLAHGFSYGGDIGIATDLSALREGPPVPDDLEIERVGDGATLAA
jgi:hypothetical protein